MGDIERILTERYKKATSKLILLDYDGTLVKYENFPSDAKPSARLLDILLRLKKDAKIIIVTGRKYQEIDKFLGHLQIDIIAEHGALVKKREKWEKMIIDQGLWKKEVITLLKRFNALCQNSFIEEKLYSLAWHYRNVEPKQGFIYSRELIHALKENIHVDNLKILDGNNVIEVMSKEISKGQAVKKVVEQNHYEFILSMGDDITDEEMFEYFLNNDQAFTVKVGKGDTKAKYRLNEVEDAVKILEQISFEN